MSVFLYYFGWPDGAVYSNLIASGICAVAVWQKLRAEASVRHAELLVRQELGRRELKRYLDEHLAGLKGR